MFLHEDTNCCVQSICITKSCGTTGSLGTSWHFQIPSAFPFLHHAHVTLNALLVLLFIRSQRDNFNTEWMPTQSKQDAYAAISATIYETLLHTTKSGKQQTNSWLLGHKVEDNCYDVDAWRHSNSMCSDSVTKTVSSVSLMDTI